MTTNFVFDETITLLRVRLGWSVARDFGRRMKNSAFVSILPVENRDEEEAWEIFRRYKDVDFSYTDRTSFALMRRLHIDTAFSFDTLFRVMKFQLVPSQ